MESGTVPHLISCAKDILAVAKEGLFALVAKHFGYEGRRTTGGQLSAVSVVRFQKIKQRNFLPVRNSTSTKMAGGLPGGILIGSPKIFLAKKTVAVGILSY